MKINVTTGTAVVTRNSVAKCEVAPSTRCAICGSFPYGAQMWRKSIIGADGKPYAWHICARCAATPEKAEEKFKKISARIKISQANAFSKPRD